MNESCHDERLKMVRTQLVSRGIRDDRILDAFRRVPRQLFVPESLKERAYWDRALPIGEGQTISQPYMVAVMVQCSRLESTSRVLEIGTGSGYEAAILAELAERVFTIERLQGLSARAELLLRDLGYEDIEFRVGDGTLGWPSEAPFDAIIVSAGGRQAPRPLLDQLADRGRLIIPLQDRSAQILHVISRKGDSFSEMRLDACSFVPLIGKHGWPEQ